MYVLYFSLLRLDSNVLHHAVSLLILRTTGIESREIFCSICDNLQVYMIHLRVEYMYEYNGTGNYALVVKSLYCLLP